MRVNRMRRGEYIALAGALGLALVMSLNWYGLSDAEGGGWTPYALMEAHRSGWAGVGWFAAASVAIAIVVCLLWLLATVTHDSPALPVAGEVVTIALGAIASIALLSRLVFQPGLGLGLGNARVELLLPAFAGPLLAMVLTVGAWVATADERTQARYSQPGDIELRPLPE